MSLQYGMLTNVSHTHYITGRMVYIPSSADMFLSRMAYVPSSADIFLSRMAYVPLSVHENHVLANAPYIPNIQKISNIDTYTDTNTLSNPNTHSLSFNIIYTPKSEIISQYKRSYPKAIVPHWFEILELMSYKTAIKSDTQILKITSTVDTNFDRTICFKFDITLDFKISNYIKTQIVSFYIKLRSSLILTFCIYFLLTILSIFDINIKTTMIVYKLQYLFQRNCMLRHDYIVLLQKLNTDHLYIIYPLKLYSIVILQHIKTLYIILIPFRFFLLTLNQLMKYSQRYRIKKLNTFKSRLTDGGLSNIFSSEDLAHTGPVFQY